MAIERLSFPEYLSIQAGVAIYDASPAQLLRIARHFGSRGIRRLKEGEYDITPPIWERPEYKYNLTVLGSGFGLLRMLPRYSNSSSAVFDNGSYSDLRVGGRLIRMPEDQPIVVVAGPNRLTSSICLYELVYFIPGPNPR